MTTQQTAVLPVGEPLVNTAAAGSIKLASTYELVDAIARISRLVHRVKAEFAARHPGSQAGYGAMSLLIALVDRGPRRAGALAESVLMDPSQVSRRVAALVRAGLVERRADFADGRAIVLAATPAGEELCAAMMHERAHHLRGVVQGWPAGDVVAFVGYLDRFASQLEQTVVGPSGPVRARAVPRPASTRTAMRSADE